MTQQPQHPQEEFYWLTKSQLDTLLLDLEYHRYNLARQTEEAIRSQKYVPHSSTGAQQRIDKWDMLKDWLLHYENNSMFKWEVKQKMREIDEHAIALLQAGRK